MAPKESGLLVPPLTGDEGALLGKYSLMGLLVLWASPAAIMSGRGPLGCCIKLGPLCVVFVFRFRFRSVGVLGVVTGFSGLGSRPATPAAGPAGPLPLPLSAEWLEAPPVLESWLWKAIGL